MRRDEIQRKAEWFVQNVHSKDSKRREEAWVVGMELHEQFLPLIKSALFSSRNKMNVEQSVWSATISREGHQDMMSEGKVRFFEALCEYDPGSGVYFIHYIKSKIQYGIFNYLRNGQSFDHALQSRDSLDEILSEDPDTPSGSRKLFQKYILENSREQADTNEGCNLGLLREAWNQLSQRQKEVLDLVINREYTLREAAKELGCHFTTVRGIRESAIRKMREFMKNSGNNPEYHTTLNLNIKGWKPSKSEKRATH